MLITAFFRQLLGRYKPIKSSTVSKTILASKITASVADEGISIRQQLIFLKGGDDCQLGVFIGQLTAPGSFWGHVACKVPVSAGIPGNRGCVRMSQT